MGTPLNLSSGKIIGPYRLLFQLGKGGMGEVWAAQTQGVQGFEKLVAIKILLNAKRGSNSMVMFFDEARSTAALQHAAIVPTVDLGEANGVFYIAMDLVRGPSLTALLQRMALVGRPMAPALVAYIGERIASALDYAYARAAINGKKLQLIHRDVSPHNILLDTHGSVRLTDFGVARTAVQDHRSRVGTVRGKPSYMSPEQVRSKPLGPMSDVFSLGIVMYECASLRRLFGRGQPVKSMDAVVSHTPTPLPKVVPGFPKPLWGVIRRALEKDPTERIQSAGALGQELSEILRELDGASTVTRDLGLLVEDTFPKGAFDIEKRIEEAGGGPDHDPTQIAPTPSSSSPKLEPMTQVAWPTMTGEDPFDPEVLDQMRRSSRRIPSRPGSIAPGRSSSHARPFPSDPALGQPNFRTASSRSGSQATGASQAYNAPSKTPVMAFVAAALALAVLAGVAGYTARSREPSPATPIAPVRSAPSIKGVARPKAPEPEPEPEPPVEPKKVVEAQTKKIEKPTRPAKAERPKPKPKSEPAKPKPAKKAPPTPEEVLALIRKVKAVDPQKGEQMIATMAEAQRDPDKLVQLARQARKVLSQSKSN